eukprot:scaffold225_cov235-Pinguiococcus_pyrenoidosus.AAC.15
MILVVLLASTSQPYQRKKHVRGEVHTHVCRLCAAQHLDDGGLELGPHPAHQIFLGTLALNSLGFFLGTLAEGLFHPLEDALVRLQALDREAHADRLEEASDRVGLNETQDERPSSPGQVSRFVLAAHLRVVTELDLTEHPRALDVRERRLPQDRVDLIL